MTATKTPPLESPAETETPEVIRVERLLPHPPGRVWRALTDKDAIEKWLLPLVPSKGHTRDTPLDTPGESVKLRASPMQRVAYEVAETDPGQRLSLWWRVQTSGTSETVTTRVTWTLTPEQDGRATRLVIEHKPFGVTAQTAMTARGSAPLTGVMARLAVYLELEKTYRRSCGPRATRSVKEKIQCR